MEDLFFDNDLYIVTDQELTQDKDSWIQLLMDGRGSSVCEVGYDQGRLDSALRPKYASKKTIPPSYYFGGGTTQSKCISYIHSELNEYLLKGTCFYAKRDTDFDVDDSEVTMHSKLAKVCLPSRYMIFREPHLLQDITDINHVVRSLSFWMTALVQFPNALEHVLVLSKFNTQAGQKALKDDECIYLQSEIEKQLKQKVQGFSAKVTIVLMPHKVKGSHESWHGRHIYTSYVQHISDDSLALFDGDRLRISTTFTIAHQFHADGEYQERLIARLKQTHSWIAKYAVNHGAPFIKWMEGWLHFGRVEA